MKRKTYLITVLLVLFVLCFFSIIIITLKTQTIKKIENEVIQKIEGIAEELYSDKLYNKYTVNANCNNEIWFLIIPSLEIKAQIKEGVDKETLKYDIRALRRNKQMEAET